MTIHPDVSGRPHVLLMHERMIEHINSHEGVEWVTFAEMCDDFKSKNTPAEGAMMPAPPGEILKKQEKEAKEKEGKGREGLYAERIF